MWACPVSAGMGRGEVKGMCASGVVYNSGRPTAGVMMTTAPVGLSGQSTLGGLHPEIRDQSIMSS